MWTMGRFGLAALLAQAIGLAAATGGEAPPAAAFEVLAGGTEVDRLVAAKLRADGIAPSDLCPDEVFVRRVFLDAIGTLPNPKEVQSFLADARPDKRERLVARLLDRPEFAEYWGLKWGDLLRVKSEFPCNLWPNAVQAYDRWIREALRSNMPYDRFARALLTSSGSNFRDPPVNFYRAFQKREPELIAENVALVFLGLRLRESGLSADQLLGFSAFFAKLGYKSTDEWKEEIVYFNPGGRLPDPADTNRSVRPQPIGGQPLDLAPDQDPRVALADWITAPDNPWFAACMANRIWYWLLGRGIVHEPDDMRAANPPWSPELLAYLSGELVRHGYDLKRVYRLILQSKTYQLSSATNAWNAADEAGFSHYRLRRLEAEPLLDAINQITGGVEKYVSPIPEPFTVLPREQRAIALADGSMESPFLELFGRPPRNTSFESERSSLPNSFQAQHLLNSSHIQQKIEKSWALRQLMSETRLPGGKGDRKKMAGSPADVTNPDFVRDLYVRILSRFPTEAEQRAAQAYLASAERRSGQSACDLAWALINTKEFILRH